VPGVLADETEALFAWQFRDGACPGGCVREEAERGWCVVPEQVDGGASTSPHREL